ncbi:hypothetical protein RRF57_006302 [Xylaria bambusicola]|uniref:Uncharacterized protein n=1 Tax=Xylaria bambusicola TaxID=326684 RepID=A0AAN7Z5G7_9PEZI
MTRLTSKVWGPGSTFIFLEPGPAVTDTDVICCLDQMRAHPAELIKHNLSFVRRHIDKYQGNDFLSKQIYILTKCAIKPSEYPGREFPDEVADQPVHSPFSKDILAISPSSFNWLNDYALEHVQFFFPPSTTYRKRPPSEWLWVLLAGDVSRFRAVCYGEPYWKFVMLEPVFQGVTNTAMIGTKWLKDPLTGSNFIVPSTPITPTKRKKGKKAKAATSPVKVVITPADSDDSDWVFSQGSSDSDSDETMIGADDYPHPKRIKTGRMPMRKRSRNVITLRH